MRQATIPITDDGDVCKSGYIVEYKISGVEAYTTLYPQPTDSPIIIEGLQDDTEYDLRIYRICCDGQLSVPTNTTFTTEVTSPV